MLKRLASVLLALALGSAAAAALAQPAAPPARDATVAAVTVEGAPKPSTIETLSHSFVHSHAAAANPEIDQIGRWHAPPCVLIVGLPQAEQAAMIKARIEGVAKAVGLPAARRDCRTNVEIVFTPDPQRVMDIVAARREYMLGYYHRHDHDRLKRVSRAVQAWYVTETWGDSAAPRLQPRLQVIDDPEETAPDGCGDNARFRACLSSVFNNVFMVADSKVLEGKDLGLVADYMVMLALSQPRAPDRCNALASVMDLFAGPACPGREAPDGLTPADAAYLTSLYGTDPEAKMASAQSDIALRMARMLIKANAISAIGPGAAASTPVGAKTP